jgi:hypothetical protein
MVRGWLSVVEVDGRASKLGVHVKRPVARQTSGVRYIFFLLAITLATLGEPFAIFPLLRL